MPTLSIPNTFSAPSIILSSQVNANFSAIASTVNGTLAQDNFGTMTGTITFNVVSNVLSLDITSASTAGVMSIIETGVLAAGKSVVKIASAANQTAGDAGLFVSFSSASSSIPVARFDQAGTGTGVTINQTGTGKVLQVVSTTAASVPAPVMTSVQKNALTGTAGDRVYDATIKRSEVHDGVAWRGAGAIKNVITKTTTYTATGSDDIILADTSGGIWTLLLPAAASHKGKSLLIKKTTSDFSVLTVDGNLAETIDGALTTTITTQNEALEIVCDGSNWQIIERRIPSQWISYTPTFSAGFGTCALVSMFYRRLGDTVELRGSFQTGTVAASIGTISLPAGLTIDTTKVGRSSVDQLGYGWRLAGSADLTSGPGSIEDVWVYISTNTTSVQVSRGVGAGGFTTENVNAMMNTGENITIGSICVPITGWNA